MIRLLLFLFILPVNFVNAQNNDEADKAKKRVANFSVKADSSITLHELVVKGRLIKYKAIAGTQPVIDEDGKEIASVFYTYYERTDVSNRNNRPLIISFNGGPGSASVWMHMAYTGPKLLNIDDEGYPVQPYGIKDNPNSLLDIADIVFIDPVNTGFSRVANKDVPRSKFFGVNADIKYLAEWLNSFMGQYNRWTSPKFLIGESYGTTRVSGLALELQNAHWMYLNGVILVSPTFLGIERNGPVGEATRLPYFAATAWYHKMLPADLQQKDLTDMLPEVESFTINELIPALAKGSMLDNAKRNEIAAKMSRYSGLSIKSILSNNLLISTDFFWKELLRDKGYTVGRLDSRYLGIDEKDAGEKPDYNAELTSWEHSFTPAINYYLRQDLKYKTDLKYNVFGPVRPWDDKGENTDKTGANLRLAMAENPYLRLMIQSGYYDGSICDYFDAKYSMWHIDASGRMNTRMTWKGYRSGHMMYLRKQDLVTATEDLRIFIKDALPIEKPAKY
jgi:carboxypeptidase C (cathepsin A)